MEKQMHGLKVLDSILTMLLILKQFNKHLVIKVYQVKNNIFYNFFKIILKYVKIM